MTTIWYDLLSKLHIQLSYSHIHIHIVAMLLWLKDFKSNFDEIIKEAPEMLVSINVKARFIERLSCNTQILTSRNKDGLVKSHKNS